MKEPLKISNEGRRNFLKLMAILSSGNFLLPPFLAGCHGNEKTETLFVSDNPFEILRKIKEGLRKSPDHLLNQSLLVVESKDPDKIFEFVRDKIQTLPNCCRLLSQNSFTHRWGNPNATLRYGRGTTLEKALLLKTLLENAGFKSKVMEGDFDIEDFGIDNLFAHRQNLSFAPDFASLRKIMEQYSGKDSLASIADIKDAEIEKDLENILNALPSNFEYPKADWQKIQSKIHEVEVEIRSKKILMNPSIPDAKAGKSYFKGSGKHENRTTAFNDAVNITLSLLSTSDVKKPIDFVAARIPIEMLMGNQVIISFQHHLDTKQYLLSTIDSIKTFTPAIGLAGLNLKDEDKKKYCFTGKSIHLNGDVFEVKGKQLFLNGEETVFSGDEHPDTRKLAKKIEGIILPKKFPQINLLFDVKDETDKILTGLGGKDFELYENEKPITFTMVQERELPLKILLLFDLSNSIPAEFRETKKIAEQAATIMREVKKEKPTALFKMSFFHFNRPFAKGNWTNSEDQLTSDIMSITASEANPAFIDSQLWTVLAQITADHSINVVSFIAGSIPAHTTNFKSLEYKQKSWFWVFFIPWHEISHGS